MNKNGRLFLSMFKIGMIGFGGGTALIPVIERTVIDEYGLVTKDDYDVDVMVASITPGALPVEISAGVGRRIKGSCGLLFGAIAMALPGVMLTILFTILIGRINDLLLKQIKFIAVRPIVSGLLVNVILSLIVQVKHHGAEFGAEREFIFLMVAIYLVNSLVVKKYRFRNEIIVGISIILSLALCNLLVLCR